MAAVCVGMNETKRDLIAISLTTITIAVIGMASYFAYRSDERRRTRLTAEVPAEIVEVYVNRSRNNEEARPGRIESMRISYRYVLDGEIFARTTTVSSMAGKEFKVGGPAKVCYNPANPNEAELFQVNHKCGE